MSSSFVAQTCVQALHPQHDALHVTTAAAAVANERGVEIAAALIEVAAQNGRADPHVDCRIG